MLQLFFCVKLAFADRMNTFSRDLKPLPVSVRVGQAVDVVGQAGRPKTITGFATHSTPVLLAYEQVCIFCDTILDVADPRLLPHDRERSLLLINIFRSLRSWRDS